MSDDRTTRNLPRVLHVEIQVRVYWYDEDGEMDPASVGISDHQTVPCYTEMLESGYPRRLVHERMNAVLGKWEADPLFKSLPR